MLENVVIRNLEWEDFRQLVAGYYSFFDELKRNPNLGIHVGGRRPDMAEEVDFFSRLYKKVLDKDAVASVAELDGKLVGICTVDRRDARPDNRHVGTLGIWILEGYRNSGIGTKLVKSCIKKSRGSFEIIDLTVFAGNRAALALYKSCGFEKYGFARKFVKRGNRYLDKYFMSLEL